MGENGKRITDLGYTEWPSALINRRMRERLFFAHANDVLTFRDGDAVKSFLELSGYTWEDVFNILEEEGIIEPVSGERALTYRKCVNLFGDAQWCERSNDILNSKEGEVSLLPLIKQYFRKLYLKCDVGTLEGITDLTRIWLKDYIKRISLAKFSFSKRLEEQFDVIVNIIADLIFKQAMPWKKDINNSSLRYSILIAIAYLGINHFRNKEEQDEFTNSLFRVLDERCIG